jgi:hypothetical protein
MLVASELFQRVQGCCCSRQLATSLANLSHKRANRHALQRSCLCASCPAAPRFLCLHFTFRISFASDRIQFRHTWASIERATRIQLASRAETASK